LPATASMIPPHQLPQCCQQMVQEKFKQIYQNHLLPILWQQDVAAIAHDTAVAAALSASKIFPRRIAGQQMQTVYNSG